MSSKRKRPRLQGTVRPIIQVAVFALVFIGSSAAILKKSGIDLPFSGFEVHGICPFGGVETLYSLLTSGAFIQKTQMSAIILLLLVLVSTLFFGAIFCGWICPFGTFQEFIGKVGRKLFPRAYNRVPRALDRPLRYLRYVMLVVIVVITARIGKMAFESFDPYSALMNILSDEVALGGLIFLGIVAGLSLIIERPFCKYFCPFGAILGLVSLASAFRPRRSESTCIRCHTCDHSCPMNIEVSAKKAVRNHQCISCFRCMSDESCPVENTVVLATPVLGKASQIEKEKAGDSHEN